MPLINAESYRPPLLLRNGHLATILPSLLRVVPGVRYHRERMSTLDADFLDIDWARRGERRLAILCHGLEGSTASGYMRGMTRVLNRSGWDVAALNFRGCSGSPNQQLRSYHSGVTEDLAFVVDHAITTGHYRRLCLVGFSLGGNVVLKYLGDLGREHPSQLACAIAISVPVDLESCSNQLELDSNAVYRWHFVRTLRQKYREKASRYPAALDQRLLASMRTIRDFDEAYTAPVHGFLNAADYWERCSSRPVLQHIALPTLLINAEDDPFLPEICYPRREARESASFFLATPRYGGHVGFATLANAYWHESLATRFIGRHAGQP